MELEKEERGEESARDGLDPWSLGGPIDTTPPPWTC